VVAASLFPPSPMNLRPGCLSRAATSWMFCKHQQQVGKSNKVRVGRRTSVKSTAAIRWHERPMTAGLL
jgi:hypothetical protein